MISHNDAGSSKSEDIYSNANKMSSGSDDDDLNYNDFDESDLPHNFDHKKPQNAKKLSPLLFNLHNPR